MKKLKMKIPRFILLAVWFLVVTTHTNGQITGENIRTISNQTIKVEDLNSVISSAMDSLNVPGLSIAIINNAEIVYYHTFGVRNRETKEPVDTVTLFEAASLSKPLFAYFFMKMVDKGIVGLDEPMYRRLPRPDIKDNDVRCQLITPRMVLSHSTGFPNWKKNKEIELLFTPGQGFSYSGEAYQYLTAYLAVVNNTDWQAGLEALFQREVAIPLGMKHTFFVGNDYLRIHKATGYETSIAKPQWLPRAFGGAHTLHSEALDFARFLQAMITGRGLSPSAYREMIKEQNHFKEGNDLLRIGQTGWSLGFAMKPTAYGTRYMHTGNNTGFRAYCCFYPEKKYGLVLFMNSDKIEEFYHIIGQYLDDPF